MTKLTKSSGQQMGFGEFCRGNMVSLDGGKRLRMDDKVDFWPATGVWRVLATGEQGNGPTSLFAFLTQEREREGLPVPMPKPLETSRRILCDYCGQPAEFHTGEAVYPHRKDLHKKKFWVCWACDAWVGCREGGDDSQPLGPLAKEELRDARRKAHEAFDPIWQQGEMSRSDAYSWLAEAMGMPEFKCRISLMDVEQCRRVVDVVAARSGKT